MNPILVERRFMVYKSDMPYRKLSLDGLVDAWSGMELLGNERVVDQTNGKQFPVCAAGTMLDIMTSMEEATTDTAILLSSYQQKIKLGRERLEAEAIAAA